MAKDHIVKTFREYFNFLKNQDIILYGTGQYTELLLKELKEFHFIGLMDQNKTGKICYGLRVLSAQEAVCSGCKNMIIIANLSVAPIIYKRIREFVEAHEIDVYYMNGLKPAKEFDWDEGKTDWEQSAERFLETAMQYDVISFDLFDTLVMRKCLFPDEVFKLAEKRAKESGIVLEEFSKRRRKAEKELYHRGQLFYNLDDIYNILGEKYKLDDNCIGRIKQLELELELELSIPRTDVAECFRILLDAGKKTVIVSDMYLSGRQIQRLLRKCGIRSSEVYVSNECKASKYIGTMFTWLQEKYRGKKILHIGDNRQSDIENAAGNGIDGLYIANAETLMKCYGLDIFKELIHTDSGRYMYELFAQRCFACVFKRNRMKGKIYISCGRDLGYLFFGPLALGFMSWMTMQLQENAIEQILFVSRDGYLFYQIYQKIQKRYCDRNLPRAVYFLTSRRCASVASLKSEEDVRFILEKVCYSRDMNIKDILEKAFGISCREKDSRKNDTIGKYGINGVWKHIKEIYLNEILQQAKIERERYLRYIQSTGVLSHRTGMMNFVGRGLTQKCLQDIMECDIWGFYFALEYDAAEILREKDRALSWYKERIEPHMGRMKLGEQLLQGETIFSAPHGAVIAFSDSGEVVCEQTLEARGRLIEMCQEGVLQYISDALDMEKDFELFSQNINLADAIFGMLTDGRFLLSDEIKEGIVFEDRYQ